MPAPPPPLTPSPTLLVLGAGMAGVAAAVRLAQEGHAPLLVEARPYVGGRTRSFVHELTGEAIDNGQHLLMGCYHQTFEMLEALGTRGLVRLQPKLHVEFRDADGRTDTLRAHPSLPSPLDVAVGMLRLKGLSLRERLSLFRVALEIRRRAPGDSETVEQFLKRLGQSPRVCRRLWYPLAIATLNTPPDVASAQLFHEVLSLGFLGSGNDSSLGFATDGLSELVEPVGDYLRRHGGDLVCGATVTAIEPRENGYLVRLKEREPIVCRGIISTIPPRLLARAVSQGLLDESIKAASDIPSSPIVSLYLWYDRPLESIPVLTAMIGTRVEWVFNRRRMAPMPDGARHPGLLSCTISAAAGEATEDAATLTTEIDRELRAAFPELDGVELIDSLLIKEKHATFLATPETERKRPEATTGLPRFYLAGDWTDIGLPATIEGAVASGVAAATLLVEEVAGSSDRYVQGRKFLSGKATCPDDATEHTWMWNSNGTELHEGRSHTNRAIGDDGQTGRGGYAHYRRAYSGEAGGRRDNRTDTRVTSTTDT